MSRYISSSVVVTIQINNAGQATANIAQVGNQGGQAFGFLSQQVNAAVKALTSTAAVITVWTLFLTIPEKIAAGFKKLAMAAIESADEMQNSILNTAGLLASFASFGPTLTESFNTAVIASEKLQFQFAALAAQGRGTAQDINTVFQTFVSRGGLGFTKDLDQAAKLSGMLTNIIISLTGGQQKSRQLQSEIANLMEGQARAGNVLAKIIQADVGNLDAFLARMKETGGLADYIEKKFGGILVGSKATAGTMTELIESIQGNLAIVNTFVQHAGGGFEYIRGILVSINQMIGQTMTDLLNSNGHIERLSETSKTIVSVFISIGVAIEQIVKAAKQLGEYLTGSKDTLEQIAAISNFIVNTATVIRFIVQTVTNAMDRFEIFFRAIYDLAHKMSLVLRFFLPGQSDEIDKDLTSMQANLKKAEDSALRIASSKSLDEMFKEGASNAKLMLGEFMKTIAALNGQANGTPNAELAGRSVKDGEHILDLMQKMRDERDLSAAADDKILKLEVQQGIEMRDTLGKMREYHATNEEIAIVVGAILDKYNNLADDVFVQMNAEIMKMYAGMTLLPQEALKFQSTFEDVVQVAKIAVDKSGELRANIAEMLTEDRRSGAKNPHLEQINALNDAIRINSAMILALKASKSADIDQNIKAAEQVKQLTRENKQNEDSIRAVKDAYAEASIHMNSMEQIILRLVLHLTTLRQALRDAFSNTVRSGIESMAHGIENFFSSLASGTSHGVPVWKRFLAMILVTLSEMAAAMASFILAANFAIPGIFGGFPAAFALYAAAGVLAGLASRLGSAGGASTVGTTGTGGGTSDSQRVIYLTPFQGNGQSGMVQTIDRLNNHLDRLETQSPGVVVSRAADDPAAMKVLTQGQDRALQSDTELRLGFQRTVTGEA